MTNSMVKIEERLPLSRPEDIETLRATIARGATDSEMGLFVQVCQRLRLDPFARQIYLVKRPGQPASIQVSIDGFRVVAERSGEYEGQTAPQWCGDDGEWRDVWLSKSPPVAARCGVYRRGFREPLVRVAKLDAYKQPGPFWQKMPEHMLSKVAEALALRAAFPHDLSGVYAPEEMGAESAPSEPEAQHATVIDVVSEPAPKPAPKAKSKPAVAQLPPAAVEVIERVQAALPSATVVRVGLDPEAEVASTGLDPRTQRAVIIRRCAELGISAADVADYLGHPAADMTRAEGDDLTEVLALVRAGEDTFAAILDHRMSERARAGGLR